GNVTRALGGETVWDAGTADKDESAEEAAEYGEVVEVYAPIRVSATGQPVGVFEVYMPYGPIRTQVRDSLLWVWIAAVGSALVLYLVQLRLVKSAADRLRATEAEVDEVNTRLQRSLEEAEEHSIGTLRALNAAVDAKDSYTARHSLHVADAAVAIGKRIGLSERDLINLERAALLHDLGKIGIPESILLKPKRLTREEFLIVRDHSEIGARIIESIPFLQDLVPIVRYHHERWDGTGYPEELAGEKVPLLARVLAVADAFEAMTADRPYRRAMRVEVAREELERNAGLQFDPVLVKALVDALAAGEITVPGRGA
ncbi:MAG: HD-GYP domain-containing protein, partial [Coriobacteriia bacterium]|nr:HD-GYP domain-containing protein [Coriobacteriia bacterium]